MASMDEQEVTITWLRSEDVVRIYTSNPVVARQLRKEERVTQVKGDEEWGEFTVAITDFHPTKGFKRRRGKMSEEQRAATVERLAKARKAKA